MSLAVGQTLSCYEILGALGAGGMGEVYRARDKRLGREVAIKVIPEEAVDDERLRRFEREARVLAALNHPNVAAIHGVDRDGGVSFLALELVPGEDLAAKLARGALRLDEAVAICRQIAEGLEAAHEAGIVHRDLKPANVRVTPDGVAKILDFGLAKPAPRPAGDQGALADTLSHEGLVVGTPRYMSPEQIRGRPVDRRTDIWAFGCILFECLSGVRAYDGEDVTSIMAAVLERDWDRAALPPTTPPRVRELVGRCLDKDPRSRLRDIGEARVALEQRIPDHAPPRTVEARLGSPVRIAAMALVAFAVGLLVATVRTGPAPDLADRSVGLSRLTQVAGMEGSPAVSPDEKVLAFVAPVDGRRQVWVRLMAPGSVAEPLTTGPAEHSFPRWIDENTLLYFRHPDRDGAEGSLWEVQYAGRKQPLRICAARGEADFAHHSQRIAMLDDGADRLIITDRRGTAVGEPWSLRLRTADELSAAAEQFGALFSPRWSHDDRSIAFAARRDLSKTDLCVIDLGDGSIRTVADASGIRGIAWLPDDSGLVFASSAGSTLAYPPEFRLHVVRFAEEGESVVSPAGAGYASYVEPDVTSGGLLVASRVAQDSDIYRFPIAGEPLDNVRRRERITYQTGGVQVPTVGPRDEEVAYLSDDGGRANVWVTRYDGTGVPRRITDEADPLVVIGIPVWSPTEDLIAYYRQHRDRAAEQWLVRSDRSDPHPLAPTGGGASWSADGEWLYQISTPEHGRPVAASKVRVSTGEVAHVRDGAPGLSVTRDGSTGYFGSLDGDGVYKVSPIDTGERQLLVGGLRSRIPLWPHHFALSPDEQWLATPLRDDGTTNLFLISTTDGTLKQVTDFGRRSTMIARQVSWSRDSQWIVAAVRETDADIVLLDGALEVRTAAAGR